MPVIEHPVHQHGVRDADHRYGCFNRKPFKAYTVVRDGYWSDGYEMTAKAHQMPFRMSCECRYDRSLSDSACAGCTHAGLGEQYVKAMENAGAVR